MEIPELTIEAKSFSCARCGTCCNDMLVFLNVFDIKRLSKISGWSEWLDFAELKGEEFEEVKKDNFPARIEGKMLFPVLKMLAEGKNCLFLGFEQGLSGCKIWSERPMVCRTFPFEELDSGKIVFIDEAVEFGCKASMKSREPDEKYLSDLKKIDLQGKPDGLVIEAWNLKGSGRKEDFVKFILEELEGVKAPGET